MRSSGREKRMHNSSRTAVVYAVDEDVSLLEDDVDNIADDETEVVVVFLCPRTSSERRLLRTDVVAAALPTTTI